MDLLKWIQLETSPTNKAGMVSNACTPGIATAEWAASYLWEKWIHGREEGAGILNTLETGGAHLQF